MNINYMLIDQRRARAALESSSKRDSFDMISSFLQSWNFETWKISLVWIVRE